MSDPLLPRKVRRRLAIIQHAVLLFGLTVDECASCRAAATIPATHRLQRRAGRGAAADRRGRVHGDAAMFAPLVSNLTVLVDCADYIRSKQCQRPDSAAAR